MRHDCTRRSTCGFRLHRPVASSDGKHVDRALGKVHRRPALVRLAIEGAALLDVVRHVRDVHAQPEVAVRQLLDCDRIVEVAGVLAVDRHRRDAAEIGPPADVALRDGRAEPDRFRDGLGPVRVGNAVLPDDDFRVDARRVDVAEHLGDPADRAARGGRPPRQFHRDHLARRRAALLARRDDDVHQHAPVERHDVSHAVLVAIVAADERLVAALEDADDAPLGAPGRPC